jgi:cytosine/adenosine deaminase-related metal-dependent hydrolase
VWADNGHSWLRERLDLRGSRAASLLDLAEMLKAGVTTVADFFSMHDGSHVNASP